MNSGHTPQLTDSELVAAYRAGGEDPTEELVKRHGTFERRRAYRELTCGGLPPYEADDAANDLVIDSISELVREKFEPAKGSFGPYLHRRLAMKIPEYLRKRATAKRGGRVVTVSKDGCEIETPTVLPGPHDTLAFRDEAHRFMELLALELCTGLAAKERACLTRNLAGSPHAEIAALLQISNSTVKRNIKDARTKVRSALRRYFPDGPPRHEFVKLAQDIIPLVLVVYGPPRTPTGPTLQGVSLAAIIALATTDVLDRLTKALRGLSREEWEQLLLHVKKDQYWVTAEHARGSPEGFHLYAALGRVAYAVGPFLEARGFHTPMTYAVSGHLPPCG